jgi:putative FmdB family regulatory protein
MPTYDYECDACGHRFEEFQSMKDAPLKECPKCKKNKLRRLIGTGAGIIFKGSGFYTTDYRKSDSNKNGGTSSPSKSDAKPADKPKPNNNNDGGDKSCGSCGKTGPNVCD